MVIFVVAVVVLAVVAIVAWEVHNASEMWVCPYCCGEVIGADVCPWCGTTRD